MKGLPTVATCFLLQSLRNEHYANGDEIPGELSNSEWSNTTAGAQAIWHNNGNNNNLKGAEMPVIAR